MGELNFYLLEGNEKNYLGVNALMESRLEGKKVSCVSLAQLKFKDFFNVLEKDNIDGYFNPYDGEKIDLKRLQEALDQGVNFHIKTNIKYFLKIEELLKGISFNWEY